MPLPPVIEIMPPKGPVAATVTVPGSKSITNRALILAALAQGTTVLENALWSEDTRIMVQCLQKLGIQVTVAPSLDEEANRTITVEGRGGALAPCGSDDAPVDLFVGNAGTAARFLTALVCLGHGRYRISGVPRMHERPQAALFEALRALGYVVQAAPGDRLPAVVEGTGPRPGRCRVSVNQSSQFASALLLAGKIGGWTVTIEGANPDELPYVEMTRAMVEGFPDSGGRIAIEPDASSGSYFWGAGWLLGRGHPNPNTVTVAHWPQSGWQIDADFPRHLPPPSELSRDRHLGDSIMTAIALAPFADHPSRFTDLGRLRVQECERVVAMRTELSKCGAHIVEEGDTLTVTPGPLHGATIATYNDHRMAMCFAMLGLVVPGMLIHDPACVTKTFPNFFAKLAAPPPHGLGAGLRDAQTGAVLAGEQLLAE